MEDCIFCKIIDRKLPSTIVYEDDNVIAFKDIHPQAPVHVLIVPKKHIQSIRELDSSNVSCLMDIHSAACKIADKLGILEKGFRLINNCGKDAGQTVQHIHYHLIGGTELGEKLI
jgi:histidine triad (HIT) family protein